MAKNKSLIICIILAVLLTAAIAASAVLVITGDRRHETELETLRKQLSDESSQMELTIGGLESEQARLESELAKAKDELAKLEHELSEALKAAKTSAESLSAEITKKNNEIWLLETDLANFKNSFGVDVVAQARLSEEIVTYIETMCPYVRMADKVDDKTGEIKTYKWVAVADLIEEERKKAVDAKDEIIRSDEELAGMVDGARTAYEEQLTRTLRARVLAREDVFYPSISIYYENLRSGFHFDYKSDVVYDSASVIKAPWVLSLLQAVSADEKKYTANVMSGKTELEKIDTNGDGTPDKVKIAYSDPTYDLSETVIYDKETMHKTGSGKIKDMADGTEFTWLQFIQYTLEASDNVAYQALRGRYGFTRMTNLASRVGAKSVLQSGRNMTAADAGKLFRAIWEFTENDDTYGPIMAASMRKAGHTVIIPYAVYPTGTMHKYGWDTNAYHDAAIVLHKNPYVLAVFTDLDKGGDEINAFLQGAVKMVHELHLGFSE